MLDRLALLNGLLQNVKVATSEDDEDFDIPLYSPPAKPAAPKTPIPPIATPAKPVPIQTPSEPAAPAPPAPVQPTKKPESQALPSWFDPSWKPVRKMKIQDEFSTAHWGKPEDELVKAEPPVAAPKVEVPVQTAPEPEPESAMSFEDARDYLESLPEDPHLQEAITAMNYADEELRTNYKNKRLVSTTLALVIAHLRGLIDHAESVFGESKGRSISAVQILIDHFNDEIKKLPHRFQERAASELYKATEGRKRGPIRELKSQWYGPELLFVNNRSIRLMKSAGMSVDEAEKMAQDEWNQLTQLIHGLLHEQSERGTYKAEEEAELQKLGAQRLLGGGSFDDAKKLVAQHVEAINAGIISTENLSMEDDQLKKLFPNVRIDPDANWEEDLAKDMTDEDMVKEDLSDLPSEVIDKLAPSIVQFGQQALKFAALKDAIERGIDEDKMIEADDALQMIYDNIEVLASQIFVINPEYINKPLAHEKFEDIYVVFKSVRAEAKDQGLESISDRTISSAESVGEGLSIDPGAPSAKEIDPKYNRNPRLQRPNEGDEEYKARQVHEKELADASRHRYLQRMLARGDALGYLERKRQYREQYKLEPRPKETPAQYRSRVQTEEEMDRIRKPEYKKNKQELVKWRKLATMQTSDVPNLRDKIKQLFVSQENRTQDLYKRIIDSWLPESTLNEIEETLQANRISKFQHEYDVIKALSGMNELVLKSMEYLISQIPRYFEDAKIAVQREKTSYSRITLDWASKFASAASI